MALPIIPLPKSEVEVGGTIVKFHSLSRKDALSVSTNFKDDPDAAEIFILVKGADVTEVEASVWRANTDATEVGKLVDGIIYLSGLAVKPEKTDETAGESENPKA